MSSRDGAGGGAPGGGSPVVARGKIKVDARKAIAKLRDHLLVDLHLYATEIARVAEDLHRPFARDERLVVCACH